VTTKKIRVALLILVLAFGIELVRGEVFSRISIHWQPSLHLSYSDGTYAYSAVSNKTFFPLVFKPPSAPNDPFFQKQWGLEKIDAVNAWKLSKGDGVIIALVDTGVDLNHPDLSGKIVPGYDYVSSDSYPQDDNGHGTHVAGIAAASTNNQIGVAGLGWNAPIMPVKVLNSSGAGLTSWIANGIIGAANHGAKIINLSLGGDQYSDLLQSAVNYATGLGALVIAAAGNCGDPSTYRSNGCSSFNPTIYPAANQNVLAVGATDSNDNRGIFSSYGSFVDVSAPGVNIYSTILNDTYAYASGTSMAAPFVSGLAALVWAENPSLTSYQVGNIIVGTADDLGPAGRDDYFGYGRINAAKAVTSISQPQILDLKLKPLSANINPETNSQFEPGVILVGFESTKNLADKMEVATQIKLEVVENIQPLHFLKLKVEPGTEISQVKKLRGNPSIKFAEPNYFYYAQ